MFLGIVADLFTLGLSIVCMIGVVILFAILCFVIFIIGVILLQAWIVFTDDENGTKKAKWSNKFNTLSDFINNWIE